MHRGRNLDKVLFITYKMNGMKEELLEEICVIDSWN